MPRKNEHITLKHRLLHLKNNRLVAVLLLLGLPVLIAVSALPQKNQAAPFGGCDTNGYLYKYPSGPTDIHSVDMVTGQDSLAGSIPGRHINAVGYNVKDNFIYGWDEQNSTFVRVHSDHSTVDPLTITGYGGPTTGIIIGDVDDNGHYWQLAGNTWYQIDLNTPTPTFIASATPGANPTGSAGADWAFVPGTDSLYRTMDNGTDITVWAFNRTSKSWSNVGTVTNITAAGDRTIGANYADPNGHLYGSSNGTGSVWRIDLSPFNATAAHVGTGNPSSSNDGARCALAPVPTDAGDAPSSYDTLFEEGGPRHGVIGYNSFNKTGQLMLGKKVDIENNGFPSSQATGDDADDIDDERGVTHIVATPGTPIALNIPAYVTNGSGQSATLAGWVDLDNDGIFEVSERTTTSIPAGSFGTYELNFPTTTFTTNTFARFRLFSTSDTSDAAVNLLPTGSASSGEVEDVLVQVGTYDVSKAANPAEGSSVSSGQNVTYTLTIQNTGLTALTNLKIDDNLADVLDDATLVGNPSVNPGSAGTANVSDNVLEFVGDIGIGQTVTVTYAVKIKDAGALGNAALHNMVLAAHSTDCHPDVDGGSATVDHPDCSTTHTVLGLANTGSNVWLIFGLIGGLFGSAALALYVARRRLPNTNQ